MDEPGPIPIKIFFAAKPHNYKVYCEQGYACLKEGCARQKGCILAKKMRAIIKARSQHYNTRKNHHEVHGIITAETICELYYNSLIAGFTCQNCGRKMVLGGDNSRAATIDHITARGNGGTNEKENLQLLCSKCNTGKAIIENPGFDCSSTKLTSDEIEKCIKHYIQHGCTVSQQ